MSRISDFCSGASDRVPFMPILMRFCARHTNTRYRDFILDPAEHCRSNIECAGAFRSDWVNVMSDPYGELEAYGAHIEYPEDSLPMDKVLLFEDVAAMADLPLIDFRENRRTRGRLEELEIYRRELGDSTIICGWVEGVVAEYCDLRGLGNACLDFYDFPDEVAAAQKIIFENARNFITLQVQAGANCIGIGDAACSQVGPELYEEFGFDYEKALVGHIHSLGALAKLHICGNTSAILPRMIETGADIIDVDHLVRDMAPFAGLLGPGQVFCGNLDPVSIIQNGTPDVIRKEALKALAQAPGKLILSAGCEITPGTSEANLKALGDVVHRS